MARIFYEEYRLRLKGKPYDILIPKLPLEEAWVMSEAGMRRTEPFLEGNFNLLQCLWDALVTLTLEKDKVIYFPVGQIPQLGRWKEYKRNYDLVFYNHQLRLPEYLWGELLRRMRYVKPHCHVVSYSCSDFIKKAERKWERFRRSSRYYLKKSWPREKMVMGTLFVEGSVELNCENIDLIYAFMQRDLDQEAADPAGWFPCVYILGLEYYYVTKMAYEIRKEGKRE